MEFKTNEEAQKYIQKIEDEKKNLSDLKKKKKVAMQEKENSINSLNQEINRLKIKNYELFEQIPVAGQAKTDTPKKDENEIDINYLLKNFDN